jgi:hypothetical protein
MKLPRDVSGADLAKRLGAWATKSRGKPAAICGYLPVSMVSTMSPFPITTPLKVGTLAGILGDVAAHFEISRDELIQRLFD